MRRRFVGHRVNPGVMAAGGNPAEPFHSGDDRLQRGRNHGILRVGGILATLNVVVVQFGVKGNANLARVGAEADESRVVHHPSHAQALRFEPGRNLLDVLPRGAEAFAELRRREPPMILGRGRLLLARDEPVERRLLFGAAPEDQVKAQFEPVFHRAEVAAGGQLRADIARQSDQTRAVDRPGDERTRRRRPFLRGLRAQPGRRAVEPQHYGECGQQGPSSRMVGPARW